MYTYIIITISFFVVVLTADYSMTPKEYLKTFWEKKPYKKSLFWLLLAFFLCQIRMEHQDQAEASVTDHKLMSANEKLNDNHNLIKEQQRIIAEQSKSINSLVYGHKTAYSAKCRFVKNFEILSIASKFDKEQVAYLCLVCDDGVAVYWYNVMTEKIIGFYFFSDAEINNVLRQNPLSDDFIGMDGVVKIEKGHELYEIYKECWGRKIPKRKTSAVAQEFVGKEIDNLIKLLLTYVYRAERNSISISRWEFVRPSNQYTGTKKIGFSYIVDPCKKNSMKRRVTFDLEASFLNSLCGLSQKEVYEKLIEKLNGIGVAPKVSPDEIKLVVSLARSRMASGGVSWNPKLKNATGESIVYNNATDGYLGCQSYSLSNGVNYIELGLKPLLYYPTMDKTLVFNPETNFVGDVISFVLDGRRDSYEVKSWDGTNYILRATDKHVYPRITLADISYLGEFWITHRSFKPLTVTPSGKLSGYNKKYDHSMMIRHEVGTIVPKNIKLEIVPRIFERPKY